LADLVIDGKPRKVLMQAPKNGFFYVLDRATGRFISGRNYVPVTWAKGLAPRTGRPLANAEARYERHPAAVLPGPSGAHNWHPMSFDPVAGIAYIPIQQLPSIYARDPSFTFKARGW